MRPPWLGHSRDEAELEALQTDVMRFMAIIGLCLAAIFSLVQSAGQEQAVAEQVLRQQTTLEHAIVQQADIEQTVVEKASFEPVAPEESAPEKVVLKEVLVPAPPPPKPTPPIAQSTPVVGFTLEFASVQALEALLQAGHVQLYARHRDQFWSVGTQGAAVPVETPASYYQMHNETVPQRLRNTLPDTEMAAEITWGVTLPSEAIRQIQRLTVGREGGHLLIGYDGVVSLEADQQR